MFSPIIPIFDNHWLKARYMTWKEAIRKVLLDEGGPLHYTDITTRIFDSGYRGKDECGATPEQTVCAQLATKKEIFRQLGGGVYELIDPTADVPAQPESKSEKKQLKEEAAQIERNNIIKNFGMFWSRADVNWKTMNLYGTQNIGPSMVNFKDQRGIYLLHDAREVIYVGQAVKQPISKRLADHCRDRLNGRWDRFSWFGFYGVNEDGALMQDDFQNTNFTMENLANAFEAILIEGLEPRQNRKAGNDFGFEFIQAQDPELEEDKAAFALMKKLMKK